MALVVKDRVKETTTTTGTGTITLLGAVSGFQDFSVIGNTNTTYYAIVDSAAGAFEVGIGTFSTTGPTLSRDTILESSSGGAAVSFAAGTKDVFCTYPAERSMYVDGTTITPATAATLPVVSGGTGASSLTANNVLLGNGTSALLTVAPSTAGNVLTSNGTTWTSEPASGGGSLLGQTDSAAPFETSLGFEAGNVNTGVNNTLIGFRAGLLNTTGTRNTATGSGALRSNTTGNANTAIGFEALFSNTTGTSNTAIGNEALRSHITGVQNTAIGTQSLRANTTGADNTAIGNGSLIANTTGSSNTVIGSRALRDNTTGQSNTATGFESLRDNTTAQRNTGNGRNTLQNNKTGFDNTALGHQALFLTTGGSNTATGSGALFNNTTGNSNTALGFNAGSSGTNNLTTGNNNILIGANASASAATVSNEITIGNSSSTVIRFPHSYSTVSVLPSPVTVGRGARTFVTDALAPVFQATVAGGGAVFTPVYSDGTDWKVG